MKYLNRIYLGQTVDYLKKNGWKNVLNKVPEYLLTNRGYQSWRREHIPSPEELARQKILSKKMENRPLFSILVPAFNTDPLHLRQMVESVFEQTYGNWELCIADGSPKPSKVEEFFHDYAREYGLTVTSSVIPEYRADSEFESNSDSETEADSEIPIHSFPYGSGRVLLAGIHNMGIAGNTNAALALSSGDFIVLLDHDDLLSPDALFELARVINSNPSVDVLYTDEDMVSADGTFYQNPNFKPEFNLDLLRSCNYITHLYAVRRTLALSVHGFAEEYDGSQDYDFILKTIENASCVYHIPKILYHWRIHTDSVASDSDNKSYAYDSAVHALQIHYQRSKSLAFARKDSQPGFYLTDYPLSDWSTVSVLSYHCKDILMRTLHTLSDSVYSTVEFPESPEDMSGEYVLVLRHISAVSPELISLLLANCMRPEIAIAVPRIQRADGKILEAGLIYNAEGQILSPFAGRDPSYPGYHRYALCQHLTSLAGPYCFMTTMENLRRNWRVNKCQNGERKKRDLYDRMADFCFRTLLDKKQITMVPQPLARLTETGTLEAKSSPHRITDQSYIQAHPVDPYYTPNFSQNRPYRFTP